MRGFTPIRGRGVRNTTLTRDYRCGVCESRLREVWEFNTPVVRCAKNPRHDENSFITAASLEHRVHNEMVQAETLNRLEREGNMALKDRDTGGMPKRLRLKRIGRIRQGKLATNEQGRQYPEAIPYFIIDPRTDSDEERAEILATVAEAIEQNAPPQDLNEPTVLPIRFLASEDEIISPEAYKKRKGKQGTVWCLGDGEQIQWKLTDNFTVQIANGEPEMDCPGGSEDGRHDWCDECKPEVELNFSIVGYERTGTWMLRTSAMGFRDQFRTTMAMVKEMINGGIISGIADVPFLLRRQEEMRLVPTDSGKLISRAMPDTSIEIDPQWFQDQMRRHSNRHALAAGEAEEVAMIESGDDVEAVVTILVAGELPGVSYEEIDDWNTEAEFWAELIRQARARLGYKDGEDVKGALRALFGDVKGAAEYAPEDIWQMLREHKMVPDGVAPF